MNKKVFIWFMTLSLIFTLVPSLALASGTDSDIRYGYYINGQWQESDIQNSNFDIEGLQSISKTAVPVVGQCNSIFGSDIFYRIFPEEGVCFDKTVIKVGAAAGF